MKNLLIVVLVFAGSALFAQTEKPVEKQVTKEITKEVSKTEVISDVQVVEASCGQCNFGMKGQGCNLAVRMEGKTYAVDGVSLHDVGDPHSDKGMCNVVRKAEVKGAVVDGRFKAESFKLVAMEKETDK